MHHPAYPTVNTDLFTTIGMSNTMPSLQPRFFGTIYSPIHVFYSPFAASDDYSYQIFKYGAILLESQELKMINKTVLQI